MDSNYSRKRLKTGHALCRLRKRRCDGKQPCLSCQMSGDTCYFSEMPAMKSKADRILDTVLSVEARLNDLMASQSQVGLINALRSINSWSSPEPERKSGGEEITAAVTSDHKSGMQNLLLSTSFDNFPQLRCWPSIFEVEYARPKVFVGGLDYPETGPEVLDILTEAFQRNVNCWYPVLPKTKLDSLIDILATSGQEPSTQACLANIVAALGGVCVDIEQRDPQYRSMYKPEFTPLDLSTNFFSYAHSMLSYVYSDDSPDAVLCVFYFTIYMCYLKRPLQVSTYLNSTSHKCQLLLAYTPSGASEEVSESIRRIFWSCYILESDVAVELNAIPQSGCALIQSTVPLPGQFFSHADDEMNRLSSLYFLACISIRRLLNRVHSLIYSKEVIEGSIPDTSLIRELDYQLEEWRDLLPDELRFVPDTSEETIYKGFLRQRYFACKSVIFRPFLNYVVTHDLENEQPILDKVILENAYKSLYACFLHISDLRGFVHTILIDSWIASLSMATMMLVFHMTLHSRSLSEYIRGKISVDDIIVASVAAEEKLQLWKSDCLEESPTMRECVNLMSLIRESYSII